MPRIIQLVIYDDFGDIFGKVLRMYREEKGMTQGDLYKRTGIERSIISKIESGEIKSPRLGTAIALVEGLGVDIREFVERMKREADKREKEQWASTHVANTTTTENK